MVLGHGHAIRSVLPYNHTQALQEQLARTFAVHSARLMTYPPETVAPVLLAAQAMQDFNPDTLKATPFSSAAQIVKLFEGLEPKQLAINLLNGRTMSAYNGGDVTEYIMQGFDSGELLLLPRDEAMLYTPPIQAALPGAVLHLLLSRNAQSKAFARYLRHGGTATPDEETLATIASVRSCPCTWLVEARQERELTGKADG